jgi:tetratricopeptide (TPR) repeat protein
VTSSSDQPGPRISALAGRLLELPLGRDDQTDQLRATGLLELGLEQRELGQHREALVSWAEADYIFSGLPSGQRDAAAVRLQRARLLAGPVQDYDQALSITDGLTDAGADLDFVADVYQVRLRSLRKLGRWTQAFDQAGVLLELAAEAEPSARPHLVMAQAHWLQSTAARQLGRLELALPAIDAAIAVTQSLPAGEDSPQARAGLMSMMLDRAVVFERLGDRAGAVGAYGAFIRESRGHPDQDGRGVKDARRRQRQLRIGYRLTAR